MLNVTLAILLVRINRH